MSRIAKIIEQVKPVKEASNEAKGRKWAKLLGKAVDGSKSVSDVFQEYQSWKEDFLSANNLSEEQEESLDGEMAQFLENALADEFGIGNMLESILDEESGDDEEEPEDDADESSDSFKVYVTDGDSSGTIELTKSGSKWTEKLVDGDLDLKPMSYQSYLTPQEILKWIKKDYDSAKLVDSDEE